MVYATKIGFDFAIVYTTNIVLKK